MLRKVVGEAHDALESAAAGTPHTPGTSRGRTSSNMSTDSAMLNTSASSSRHAVHTPPRKRAHSSGGWGIHSGAGGGGVSGQGKLPYTVPGPPEAHPVRPEYPVTISGADLRSLLQRRPELSEFLALEIAAMKLETERLTGVE
jgi:hypothetical protein